MERIIEIVDHGGPEGWHSYSFGEAREKVVRCRDCRWFDFDIYSCKRKPLHMAVEPDGFCAWGERRA